jgi:hypothetical protein
LAVAAPPDVGPVEVQIAGPLPLPVQQVNVPSQQPFSRYAEFSSFSCSFECTNFVRFGSVTLFDVGPVPAGKSWVITRIAGRLPNDSSADVSIALQRQPILAQQYVTDAYYGPFFSQFGVLQGFSAPLSATVGPGEYAHVNVVLPATNNFIGFVTLSGYLVDAPAGAAAALSTAASSTGDEAPAVAPGSLPGSRPELQ